MGGAGADVHDPGEEGDAAAAHAEPGEGDGEGEPGADHGAEGQHEDDQGRDHADQLAVPLHGGGGVLRDLAAQLDLEAEGAGAGDGLLEGLEVAHQVRVGDGDVVPDRDQRGVAVSRQLWGLDGEDVRHPGELARERLEGDGVDRGAGAVVDHDLGGGEAGLGEVGAQLLDAGLGRCVGDVVVIAGLAAEGHRETDGGDGDGHPGADRAPRVRRGAVAEAVEEAGHGGVSLVRGSVSGTYAGAGRLGRAWGRLRPSYDGRGGAAPETGQSAQ